MYFSECFNIPQPKQYDWFDPILERDTLLFVDPFLIFKDRDEKWRNLHRKLMEHFQRGFMLLAKAGNKATHQFSKRTLILMEFPEPNEFRLGYTRASADGSGTGENLAKKVVSAMGEAIKRGLEDIRHFEELGILVEGINRDRISDITCNLLKPELIEYTQHICHSLGIPMVEAEVRHSAFDEMRMRWRDETHLVPVDPRTSKPILLVPKRFLGELPTLAANNWYDFLDSSLRDDLNLEISTRVRKVDIVAAARANPGSVRSWIDVMEKSNPQPYDVDNDPGLLVKWQNVARQAANEEPLIHRDDINSIDDLMGFVHRAIDRFRHWAESRGGWRVFWRDLPSLNPISEPSMQLLFLGIVEEYCRPAGIRVDREVETGRGPVDFTFTGNNRIRVLLEMKKLTHGRFWHGLQTQTPIYLNSQELTHAIFLAVRDSDTEAMRKRWRKLDAEAKTVRHRTGLSIEIERIDILPKESASKAE
ncbi:MAG: hypothetical protein ACJ73S_30475 [Mycobacteriales bacterium]